MGKQFGVLVDDKLSKEGFMSKVSMMLTEQTDKDKAGEVADDCLDTTDEERCEAAYKIWKCIEDGAKERELELF
jgi:PBP/GOBP family